MPTKNFITAAILTSIDSSTFTGSYQAVNSSGLPAGCSIVRIINNSGADVTVSYDGTNNHDFVPKNTTAQIYFQTNSQPTNNVALMAKGTVVYVKGTSSTGLVYLAAYYQPQA